jgi:hypothetical protein
VHQNNSLGKGSEADSGKIQRTGIPIQPDYSKFRKVLESLFSMTTVPQGGIDKNGLRMGQCWR